MVRPCLVSTTLTIRLLRLLVAFSVKKSECSIEFTLALVEIAVKPFLKGVKATIAMRKVTTLRVCLISAGCLEASNDQQEARLA